MHIIRITSAAAVLIILTVAASSARAHCQIPCGIYDDPARFVEMNEHVKTIEKSMRQIELLSKESKPNWNQIVRWVNNKETHADKLTEVVTYYFMAQRVKPADPADKEASARYVHQLKLLHQMVLFAMKAKQTTDLDNCAKLRKNIADFKASYLGNHSHEAAHHDHKAGHGHADHGARH